MRTQRYGVAVPNGRPPEFVQSLERGLSVIRAFSGEHPKLTLSDVARETGMTRAAARRFLITLETLGYVASDGKLFSLRPSVLQLGYAYLSSISLTEIAQDHLGALADQLHESCSACVQDGDEIVYITRAATARIMTISLGPGTRLPMYCTAMGRVLLAAMEDSALDEYLSRTELVPLTSRTITDPDALRAEIMLVRKQGWCLIDQELESGIRSLGAPIRDASGKVVAAIDTSTHVARVTIERLNKEFLPALLECAERIDKDLAGVSF